MSATAGSSSSANAMYEIRYFGKKGKGMAAAKDIGAGEIILSEKPILIVPAYGITPHKMYKQYLALNDSDRARFRALCFHADSSTLTVFAKELGKEHDKERGKVIATFNTNCMEDQDRTKRYVAVECARINHSCRPNATYDYFHMGNVVIVRALQKIVKDDEILVPYIPPTWNKAKRAEKLWKDWGFVCECDACTSKTPGPLLSDKVSNELQQVDKKLHDIRSRARKAGQHPDKVEIDEQIKCCKFYVERTVSIKALIPNTVAKLEIYLRLLERTQQTGTPEAKKWYGEAHRLSLICRGPDDDFVTHCAEMLKEI